MDGGGGPGESRWRGRLALAGLVALLVGLRLCFLHEPLERDEGTYGAVAQAILRGDLPYRDAIDLKPPGVYYLYAAALALPLDGAVAIRLLAAACSALTLLAVAWVARQAGGPRAGLLAAALFALVAPAPVLQGSSANSEVFLLLPLWLAVGAFLRARAAQAAGAAGTGWLLLAGLGLGAAMLVKPVAAPTAALLLAAALWPARPGHPWRARLAAAGWLALPGLALALATLGAFAAAGALEPFLFWNVAFPLRYAGGAVVSGPPLWLVLRDLAPELALPAVLGLPAAAWLLVRRGRHGAAPAAAQAAVLAALLVPVTAAAVAMPGRFFPHYFILLVPALAVAGGLGLDAAWARGGALRAAAGLAAAASLAAYAARDWPHFTTMTPAEVSTAKYGPVFAESEEVAAWLRPRLRPGDWFLQWGFQPELYFLTGGRPPMPHLSTPMMAAVPDLGLAVAQLAHGLEATRPAYVVVQPEWARYPGLDELMAFLARDYRMVAEVRYALIFERRAP